jgi:hypothetical protein
MPDCNASTGYNIPNPPANQGGCCLGAYDPTHTKLCRPPPRRSVAFFRSPTPSDGCHVYCASAGRGGEVWGSDAGLRGTKPDLTV